MRPRCSEPTLPPPQPEQFRPASACGRLNALNEAPDVINEILQRSTRLTAEAIASRRVSPAAGLFVGLPRSMTPSFASRNGPAFNLSAAVVG